MWANSAPQEQGALCSELPDKKKKDTQYSSWWDRTQWITIVFDFLIRYTWLHLVTSVLIRNSPSETKMRHADTLHRSFEAPSPSHFSSTAELRNDMAMLCVAASLLKTWNILVVGCICIRVIDNLEHEQESAVEWIGSCSSTKDMIMLFHN